MFIDKKCFFLCFDFFRSECIVKEFFLWGYLGIICCEMLRSMRVFYEI